MEQKTELRLEQVMRRTRRYWFVDGLFELAFGAFCILLGLYFASHGVIARGSAPDRLLDLFFTGLVIGAGLLIRRSVGAAKRRLTYPRTGYVAYRRPSGFRRWAVPLAAALTAGLFIGLTARAADLRTWTPAAAGLVLSLAMLWIGCRSGLTRFYALAVVAALLGAAVALMNQGQAEGAALFYTGFGLAAAASGGATLHGYLKYAAAAGERGES